MISSENSCLHETPARQSSLFAQNSKLNQILNTLDLFLSLVYPIQGVCAGFFALTLYSLYTLINMLVCD